jgi:hypothetical protein
MYRKSLGKDHAFTIKCEQKLEALEETLRFPISDLVDGEKFNIDDELRHADLVAIEMNAGPS